MTTTPPPPTPYAINKPIEISIMMPANLMYQNEVKEDPQMTPMKETEKTKSKQQAPMWDYENPEIINIILKQENATSKNKGIQNGIILQKVNISMMYFLMSECDGFQIKANMKKNDENFLFIEKIKKHKKPVFSSIDVSKNAKEMSDAQKIARRRKYQIESLADLIFEECGLKFNFNNKISFFQIVSIVDKSEKSIDLFQFIQKYCQYDKLVESLKTKTTTTTTKVSDDKWEYVDEEVIQQILVEEQCLSKTKTTQLKIILRKINVAMIYYLLSQCIGYKFSISYFSTKHLIYIDKITKNDTEVYNASDIEDLIKGMADLQKILRRRKHQMQSLADLIEKESGIKFVFNNKIAFFQLLSIEDRNNKKIDLLDFLHKYEKQNEMEELLFGQRNEEINQNPTMNQFNQLNSLTAQLTPNPNEMKAVENEMKQINQSMLQFANQLPIPTHQDLAKMKEMQPFPMFYMKKRSMDDEEYYEDIEKQQFDYQQQVFKAQQMMKENSMNNGNGLNNSNNNNAM